MMYFNQVKAPVRQDNLATGAFFIKNKLYIEQNKFKIIK